jgi:hypothetical protein
VPGSYTGATSNSFKVFAQGFFSELNSTDKVNSIKLVKDRPYQNGKAAARYEILKSLFPSASQTYLTNIDPGLVGQSKKNLPRLVAEVNSSFQESDRSHVLSLFKELVKYVCTLPSTKARFSLENFVLKFDDLVAKHKRSKTTKIRNKKGKTIEVTKSYSATKPEQLSTVMPFEKNAIKELFGGPWEAMKQLRARFESEDKTVMNFQQYEKEIQAIENEMWKSKQKVLRLTKVREIIRTKDGKTDIDATIKATKERYVELIDENQYSRYVKEMCENMRKPLWIENILIHNEVTDMNVPLLEYIQSNRSKFPATLEIVGIYERIDEERKALNQSRNSARRINDSTNRSNNVFETLRVDEDEVVNDLPTR